MSIEDRNLTKGTKLTGRYHKQSYSCEVVENAEGKLRYKLEDGREFKSPSAAGMAITGHSCDGWKFWSLQTEQTAPAETEVKQTTGRTNAGTCCGCAKDRFQENRRLSGAESEGCAGGSNSLVLPGLRQELHCLGRRSAGGMPQPPSQLKQLEKGISINWQAPFIGSLPCFVLQMVTIPPLSAEVTNGDINSLLKPATRGDIW